MKKRALLLIFLVLSIGSAIVFSIITKNRFYLFVKYYHYHNKNLEIDSIGSYDENGNKTGEWKFYDKKDRLLSRRHYINDTLNGLSESFYKNGVTYSIANYFMGKMVDTLMFYYPNGQLNLIQFNDSNGVSQGEFRVFHKNGKLRQHGNFKDGRLHGEVRNWFENGKIESIANYDEEVRDGKNIFFNNNGDTLKVLFYIKNELVDSIIYQPH